MGWVVQEFGGTRIVSHSGTVPDFGGFMALVPALKIGIVLLFNANHAMMKLTLDDLGLSTARRLTGENPSPSWLEKAPWAMRGLLLIPVLQIAGVLSTQRLIRRWSKNPALRPSRGRMWWQHILLPLIPNLLAALTLVPVLGNLRGWIRLFMPDFSWIAWICGGFAVIWSFLRTGLILREIRK
jgi:hypothetical protein